MSGLRLLALGQGAFYVATGAWPLFHRRSFEAVTGPKTDWWLVQTAGTLIAAAGASLVAAGGKDDVTPASRLLGAGGAAGLAGIDIVHASRGRISKVYLLDAAAELALVAGWAVASVRRRA
jgi:hypothetical protein